MSSDWASELSANAGQFINSAVAPLTAAVAASGLGVVVQKAEELTTWFESTGLNYEPLSGVSAATGLGVDEVNYVLCMLLSYPLGSVLRFIPASSVALRHLYGIVIGLIFSFFCFRIFMLHTIISSLVVFLIIKTNPSGSYVHKAVFIFMITYMVLCHAYRQYFSYGAYILDVTGPQMILTQKLTTLGFSLHDGLYRQSRVKKDDKRSELNSLQKESMVIRSPSFLEFFGHVFYFPGYLAGPAHFFSDYKAYIEGAGDNAKAPSSFFVCIKKILGAFLCIAIAKLPGILGYDLTLQAFESAKFHQEVAFPLRLVFLWAASVCVRMKYYFAWILADGANNAAGFGFNGFGADGKSARWDRISNVNVIDVELATSVKSVLDNWNIQTQKWLRYVVYDRTGSVLKTMFLSAVWHGLYPGYFLTFVTAAFHTTASRKVRATIRPIFVAKVGQKVYDIITTLATMLILNYMTLSFVLLEFARSLRVWQFMFFYAHIIIILCLVLVPEKKKDKSAKPADKPAEKAPAEKKQE